MNSVKLYSNGTAVISREFTFQDQQPQRISIPVSKTDLDDVNLSLSGFGDATISRRNSRSMRALRRPLPRSRNG